ncbi:MAG: hypothetical protein WD059_05235 [Balneolaceae bacterium]
MKKAFRLPLIITLFVILFIFIAGLIAPFFIEEHFKNKLVDEFTTQTENQYQLTLGDLDIGIWSKSVTADSIVIEPNKSPSTLKSFSTTSVKVKGIGWLTLLNNASPVFDSITITEPETELYSRDFSTLFSDSGSDQVNMPEFDIHIIKGRAKIVYPKGGEEFSLGRFDLDVRKININALTKDSSASYLENLVFSGKDLTYMMEDKLYKFTVDEFEIETSSKLASITNFAFSPILPKYEFSEIRGHQLDRIDLKIADIELKGFEVDSLPGGVLNLDSLIVKDGWLEVFRDKHKPKAPGFSPKPLVNDMANSIGLPFGLDVALISNSTIIYEEHTPPSEEPGHISFDALDAVLKNFKSASHPQFTDDTLTLYVETKFMNAAPLTVDISYPIFREDDTHYVKAHLDSIDPQEVAGMLEFVGFVRVESGMVHELSAEMELNDTSSTGQLKLLYDDLEVSFLNENDPDRNGIREQVSDFITNKFVLKSENTAEDPRIGEISYEKEEGKSIFAYWWRSLLSGIQSSIKS